MILKETYTLPNGVEIPKLGLGTWMIDDEHVRETVRQAIDIGYRHIDTAQAYGNEEGVGAGLSASGVPREEVFLTSKLAAEIKSYEGAISAVDASLLGMGLDYLDLMIIHSPKPWIEYHGADRYLEGNREAWRALEDAYRAGKVRAIGLSNFEEADVENILAFCSISPMVNQVLAHIGNTPFRLIEYSQKRDLLVEAYSPIAHGALLDNQEVAEIARSHGVSIPQLSIRYDLQLGLLPLPKTANPTHMQHNAEVDFVISEEDMERLRNVAPVNDYGSANAMPVFGGRLGG